MIRSTKIVPLWILFSGMACGGDLPRPPYVAQTSAALERVPYPPPPARAEIVPSKPASDAVWVDGEWEWRENRFAWRRGRWLKLPPGARFAPWTAVRGDDGTEYYAPGSFRDRDNRLLADPPALAIARSTVGEIVNPEGQNEELGRNVRESVGPSDGGIASDGNVDSDGAGDRDAGGEMPDAH